MICPRCHGETRVLSTLGKGSTRIRHRQCKNLRCGHRFTTEERPKK